MALTIDKATQARSQAGENVLLQAIQTDRKAIKTAVWNDKYNTIVSTVKNNWNGVDATDFLADLKKTAEEIQSITEKVYNKMETCIKDDYTKFTKFQATNKM